MSDARGQPQTRTVSAPGNAKQAAESEDEAAVATATKPTSGRGSRAADSANGKAGAAGSAPGNGGGSNRSAKGRFVSDVIVDLGFASRAVVDRAVEQARAEGAAPEELLVKQGVITPDQLARAIAARYELEYFDLQERKPDPNALNLIRLEDAKRFQAVPVGFESDDVVTVAMANPRDIVTLDDLKLLIRRDVRPVVASVDDIQTLIKKMSSNVELGADVVEEDETELEEAFGELRETASDSPVVRLVNQILQQAIEEGASDIHFEPEDNELKVRFRVDGVLREATTIQRKFVASAISRIKIMANLDIAEKRIPQDGRVSLNVDGHEIDVRVVTMPSVRGEGVVMRILDKEKALIGLDKLGMSPRNRQRFEESFKRPHGAVLVTGPTGSGKSTTLYAALNELNSPDRKIITIEDPVEYQLPGVNQLQVNNKAGLTFAAGLRAMLRADPDVIMVGEIRDAETAQIAIESALTGHLVLSTLHTNDAPSAITRLTEMGIEPFLTASAVVCVVAQRLVRMLCVHCKERTILTVDALRAAGYHAAFDIEAYEPVGCKHCGGSGYKGRTGIHEVMLMSDEIRELTVERASSDQIRRVAIEQGMRPLREDGFEKVKQGVTSISEVARVAA